MAEVSKPITRPRRVLKSPTTNGSFFIAFATPSNGRRLVTASYDNMLCLWDLTYGAALEKMEGRRGKVTAVAASRDGKSIASGDENGRLIVWHGNTGQCLTQLEVDSEKITSLDFSPDSKVLATALCRKIKFWKTGLETWRVQGNTINTGEEIYCVRYSPSGELLAIATSEHIQIWNEDGLECIKKFAVHATISHLLTWTLDGARLFSTSSYLNPTIREWHVSTGKQVGDPWSGHTNSINVLAINSTGTLVASASDCCHVHLWRLSDRRTIAVFKHSESVRCVTFSVDGKHLLCGTKGSNGIIEWDVPQDALLEGTSEKHVSVNAPGKQRMNNIKHKTDALKSVSIEHSLRGYITLGISLCRKGKFEDATKAFDLAFMFTDTDSSTIHLLLLVKAIALFNANLHEEAFQRVRDLAAACPNDDTLACDVVEAYLHIQRGLEALEDKRHNEAAHHFTAAVNTDILQYKQVIHYKYKIFVTVFGWNLASSWQTENQNLCLALLRAGRLVEAYEAYRNMMDTCDDATKASIFHWSAAFKKECSALYVASGDAALAASTYDEAIELYSVAIDLVPGTHVIFANRCKAKLGMMLWEEALDDAEKVTELNRSSYLGYYLKHAALRGAQRYHEANETIRSDLFELKDIRDPELQAFKKECNALYIIRGNAALAENAYDRAIELYSAAIDLYPATDTIYSNRCKARLEKMSWEEALDDAEMVIKLKPSSYPGYYLKHAALHGAKQYDEAIKALQANLLKFNHAYNPEMRAFKKEYHVLYVASGNAALAASAYDRAIKLYSVAIDLDPSTDTAFLNRCRANLGKMLWDEALLDAEKVTKLNPSSYLGYHSKHAALHGAQRYDEAIEASQLMLIKLDGAQDAEMQALRRQYISPSEAQGAIQKVIDAQMEDTPPRLISTFTGYLCDRDAQIDSFKASVEYKELVSSTTKHADLQSERIQDVVLVFFQYVMLSHRWEGKEPLLRDIQGNSVYELDSVDGVWKLQSFCKVARDGGYRWAWSDTCCINKNTIIDLQESVNSMFAWYHHSALTVIYLSDVLPESKSGALANSAWISRGWTLQEFLAPKVVLFYQKDWTLYLDDRSPNHKESAAIMQELADATGINAQALVAFHPEMKDAREKLQWSSMRVTTLQEDIAYSLFGVFGVHLSPIYGEKKQYALGRLLQEIIAQSGDITCLDWVGRSSEFNSCLPANITSYSAPPSVLPSLSEDEMQASISSLRDTRVMTLASHLSSTLERLTAPRFANRRLHLPCIVFAVTDVILHRPGQEQGTYFTYTVNADGLRDLVVTTKDDLNTTQRSLVLVRPWDRGLLELFDSEGSRQNLPARNGSSDPVHLESRFIDRLRRPFRAHSIPGKNAAGSRGLRLIVHLGQSFSALLLAQQRGGEYRRIASDYNIIAQVKDVASVHALMDVRTLEIL